MSQCEAFGVLPSQAAQEVARVIDVVNGWQAHFAGLGVAARALRSLAQRIDGEALLQQCMGFDPARYGPASVKKARPGPLRRG